MDFKSMSGRAIQAELAGRVQRERLNQNLTQAELAGKAGISLRTLINLESGKDITLQSLIGVLRALEKLEHLDIFLPEPGPSPLQLARLKGKVRKRASKPRPFKGPARS